jgi:hypothetical protein
MEEDISDAEDGLASSVISESVHVDIKNVPASDGKLRFLRA